MNTLKIYKKQMRQMFFISVDRDINQWSNSTNNYYSLSIYNKDKDKTAELVVNNDFDSHKLYIYSSPDIIISRYKFLFIPRDFKVIRYVKKLKRHFKKIEQDKKNQTSINILKSQLNILESNYVKDVRKEKLKNLN